MRDVVLRVSKNKKIAVYGVCKNEESNIHKWYEHAKDADYILLLDTGSTDNTVSIAEELGINVFHASISPWSETVAKNTAMALLPSDVDICVCLDLDQIIQTPNWKSVILKDTDFNIGVADYLLANGYKETIEKQKLPTLHSRFNVFWFGYRPRLRYIDYEKSDYRTRAIDISIYHLPGTDDRFSDREDLYVKSFLVEEKRLILYSDKQYLLSTLCNIALSYFEIGNISKFNEYYVKIINLYESEIKALPNFGDYRPLSFVQLAKFLTLEDGHEEFLKDCIETGHFSEVVTPFYVRLLVVEYLKYREFKSNGKFVIPERLSKFIEDLLSMNYYEITYFLSNIEWGKSQMELADLLVKRLDCEK